MYLCHMEKHDFEEKVAEYVKEHGLLAACDNVVVALSGGADSVALLRVMLSIGVRCHALHCNFGLRGEESDRDELFVRDLCRELGVPLDVMSFDVAEYERKNKVSTEMACRELRYKWFEEMRVRKGCSSIAVAHHHDDNVETFFLNVVRGTGIQGLAGIKPKNGYIVRPLLCVTREDVENYLDSLGQDYVVDSTNLANDYKRNKIRNVLIPTLRELFPNVDAGVARTLCDVQSCNDLYQGYVGTLKGRAVMRNEVGNYVVDFSVLSGIGRGRQAALYEILRDFGFNSAQVEDIYVLLSLREKGKRFYSSEYEAVLSGDKIEVFPIGGMSLDDEIDVDLKCVLVSGSVGVPFVAEVAEKTLGVRKIEGVDGKRVVALNLDLLKRDVKCVLRRWREGDRIKPFGMKGSKLVSDIFTDAKYTEVQKRAAWLLCIDDEVVWVLGLRASRCYSVDAEDAAYLRLSHKM